MWPGLQLRSPDTIPLCLIDDWSMPPCFVMVVHRCLWWWRWWCSASCHDQCVQFSFWRHRSLQADALVIFWIFTTPSRFIVFPCSGQGASPRITQSKLWKAHGEINYYTIANYWFGLLRHLVPINEYTWIKMDYNFSKILLIIFISCFQRKSVWNALLISVHRHFPFVINSTKGYCSSVSCCC